MKLLTANSGSYPRVGEKENQLRLRQAYQKWEKDEISGQELESVYEDYSEEVIKEQEKAGLDVVTDGLLRWYDPFSHFAQNIEGCKINGLLRYFDTNFYFRQPVVEDEVSLAEPTVKDEFLKASEFASKTLKPVITGAYTMAKSSINNHYKNFDQLTLDFADIMAQEVKELSEAGAEEIQVNEPAILGNEEDFEIFSKAIEIISEQSKPAQLDLYVYFGDSTPLYQKLQKLPVDMLCLDFTYSPDLPDKIFEAGSEKLLGLGLFNARNTKMEKEKDIVSTIEKIVSGVDTDKIYLNPSCGLEFLPRKRAFEKLDKIVDVAEKAREEVL